MAKLIKRLTPLKVKNINSTGWYPDGAGLYLQVSASGSKSWVYRYTSSGKERRHGLGAVSDLNNLKAAREGAERCSQLRKSDIDPIEQKRQHKSELLLKKVRSKTFKQCAIAYIDAHSPGWKSKKHESQWRNTLEAYAHPIIGELPVQVVDVALVLKILEPIWYSKTETASRVRQRIESILDWASVRKYRTGDNPARWRGHLDKLLPKRSKVQKVKHFEAMPYLGIPDYYQLLTKVDSISALALRFTILTATRTNEARDAKKSELNLELKEWNIPAERMKADRPHRVPLSDEAISILKTAITIDEGEYVFPGLKLGTPISNSALLQLLQKDHPNLTVHGFRSSFRDWCAEVTSFPREVAEAALAHTLKDKTEAAYQRGDLLLKRRKLMDTWSEFCLNKHPEAEIVPININQDLHLEQNAS